MNKYNVGSVGPSEGVGDCVQSPRLLALITSLSALMLQVCLVMPYGVIGEGDGLSALMKVLN